jgi:hypothetical protein
MTVIIGGTVMNGKPVVKRLGMLAVKPEGVQGVKIWY